MMDESFERGLPRMPPVRPREWLEEVAEAWTDAAEAIPFGRLAGAEFGEESLFHLAAVECCKFRGLPREGEAASAALGSSLTSYVATRELNPEGVAVPELAFAFCYLTAHLGLGFLQEDWSAELMDYMDENLEELRREIRKRGGRVSEGAAPRAEGRDRCPRGGTRKGAAGRSGAAGKRKRKGVGARGTIPDEVRAEVEEIVARFKCDHPDPEECFHLARFKGRFCYLWRCDDGDWEPVCRLGWKGRMDGWDFAIYRWSTETYDPHERSFPGAGHVDGTVEGALRAGLEAYPP